MLHVICYIFLTPGASSWLLGLEYYRLEFLGEKKSEVKMLSTNKICKRFLDLIHKSYIVNYLCISLSGC